jgi:hypothetical protein
MTIKYDCPQCRGRGYYREIFWASPIGLSADFSQPQNLESYKTRDVACDCEAGRQWQVWQDRMNHPEYENPFLKMTDNEIIETLTKASENQRINDSEFNLD